jgi:hypothetical protein
VLTASLDRYNDRLSRRQKHAELIGAHPINGYRDQGDLVQKSGQECIDPEAFHRSQMHQFLLSISALSSFF